jgi:hypothetical protein
VTEELPVEALAGTVNVTFADEPAAMFRGEAGAVTTPVGRPVNATETDPENPFDPAIETVTGALVMPPTALMEDAETEIEKSAAGGGGGVEVEPPPPQPISWASVAMAITKPNARQPIDAADVVINQLLFDLLSFSEPL